MPEGSALDVLGRQFQDFLTAQFTPPPGTPTELAFLPGGVAVSPQTFLVNGVVNQKLVADWLAIATDTAPVIAGGQVSVTMSTASELMGSVAQFAQPVAPIGSPAADMIGRLKNLDSAATAPGVKVIDTAPSDWYDPDKVSQWPQFNSSASTPSAQPTGDTSGLWRWRTLNRNPSMAPGEALPHHLILMARPVEGFANLQGSHAAALALSPSQVDAAKTTTTVLTQPVVGENLSVPLLAQLSSRSAVFDEMNPTARTISANHLSVSSNTGLLDTTSQAAVLAATASTAPVGASSLTLSASYQMVLLSRVDWWSSNLINAPGWCFPGQRRGALVPGNLPANARVGVPVAMILTTNVAISGTWSDADRAAATTSTHLGPWLLSGGSGLAGQSTTETLVIPGMQLIAGIYSILPTLPPADDPALPPPPATPSAGAALTKPLVVPQYTTATVKMYTPDGTTGAATTLERNTFDVQAVVTALFPGRAAAVNACALIGNDMFIANSSADSQCIFKVPDYVTDPANAAARTFVFTLDGTGYVGIVTDGADKLFAAEGDYQNNHVVSYTGAAKGFPGADAAAQDNYATRIDLGNAGATSYFANLALDSAGNLWVSDYLNHRLVVFDAANLGQSNTFHVLANLAGPISVANTNATLRADAAEHLFAEPQGLAFDASGDLWVANNNDGDGADALQNTRSSLVRITPNLQNAILASAPGAALTPDATKSNTDFFIYQLPNLADDSGARPQFGGLQIDRAAARIYVSEQAGGSGRAYDIATIADVGTATGPNELAIVTTNPGNGGIALVSDA